MRTGDTPPLPRVFTRSLILLSNWVKAWKHQSGFRMFPHGRKRKMDGFKEGGGSGGSMLDQPVSAQVGARLPLFPFTETFPCFPAPPPPQAAPWGRMLSPAAAIGWRGAAAANRGRRQLLHHAEVTWSGGGLKRSLI